VGRAVVSVIVVAVEGVTSMLLAVMVPNSASVVVLVLAGWRTISIGSETMLRKL
jgi:hypothetical protein